MRSSSVTHSTRDGERPPATSGHKVSGPVDQSTPVVDPGPSVASLVSCVLTASAGETDLERKLDCLLRQHYRLFEIIVVFNTAEDTADPIPEPYAGHVRLARQARDGLAEALNHGASLARGEFLAFMASGEIWHPEELARQMTRLDADEERALFRTRYGGEIDDCMPVTQRFATGLTLSRSLFERLGGFTAGEDDRPLEALLARARDGGVAVEQQWTLPAGNPPTEPDDGLLESAQALVGSSR